MDYVAVPQPADTSFWKTVGAGIVITLSVHFLAKAFEKVLK